MIHIQGHQAMVGFQIFPESGDFFFSNAGHAAHIHIIRQVMNLNGNPIRQVVFATIMLLNGIFDMIK